MLALRSRVCTGCKPGVGYRLLDRTRCLELAQSVLCCPVVALRNLPHAIMQVITILHVCAALQVTAFLQVAFLQGTTFLHAIAFV